MATTFGDLPAELQGCCARQLDTMSAARFGKASKACSQLINWSQLRAAHTAEPFEKSRHGAIATYCNPVDGSKLITFSDGGAKLYKCSCRPDMESRRVGLGFTSAACHLASPSHWRHWRFVAFGETQPTASLRGRPLQPRCREPQRALLAASKHKTLGCVSLLYSRPTRVCCIDAVERAVMQYSTIRAVLGNTAQLPCPAPTE